MDQHAQKDALLKKRLEILGTGGGGDIRVPLLIARAALAAVDPALQFDQAANPADEVDAGIGAQVGDAEHWPEQPIGEDAYAEPVGGIAVRRRHRAGGGTADPQGARRDRSWSTSPGRAAGPHRPRPGARRVRRC